MNVILLIICSFCCSIQSVFKKEFTIRAGKAVYLYASIITFVAMLFFIGKLIISGEPFLMDRTSFIYSFFFAITFAVATYCETKVLVYGPLSIGTLVMSCSLLLPAFYGLIKGEPITFPFVVGLVLFVVAICLANYKKSDGNQPKANLKWVIFLALNFVANGMCSILQKAQGLSAVEIYGESGNEYTTPFMIVALAIATAAMFALSFIFENNEDRVALIKKALIFDIFAGVANGATNMLVILLNSRKFPASVMFPVISGFGIVFIYFVSRLLYKEKLTKIQTAGFAVGLISIIILNMTDVLDGLLAPFYSFLSNIF